MAKDTPTLTPNPKRLALSNWFILLNNCLVLSSNPPANWYTLRKLKLAAFLKANRVSGRVRVGIRLGTGSDKAGDRVGIRLET